MVFFTCQGVFVSLASCVAVFAGGCVGQRPGGTSGTGGSANQIESDQSHSTAERGCDIPFELPEEDEVWAIISEGDPDMGQTPMEVRGSGSAVIDAFVGFTFYFGSRHFGEPSCILQSSEVSVRFNGSDVVIEGTGMDDDTGSVCAMELRGTIDSCGFTDDILFPELNVFNMTMEGSVTFGEESLALGTFQLLRNQPDRIPPCDETPDSLAGRDWSITRDDSLRVLGPSSYDEVLFSLYGSGNTIGFPEIFQSEPDVSTDRQQLFNCYLPGAEGSVAFDGNRLILEIPHLPDQVNPGSEGCSISFTAQVVDCRSFSFPFGPATIHVSVMRLDVDGVYSTPFGRGVLPTLYLRVTEVSGGR